jgi:UDP-N-acetylmuramate: L-alanyl-gamma-D-glutamyl-meso-diaminopimelate ligase
MPEVVKNFLIGGHTSVVIAGTHGKTTTSSLTAVALEGAGLPVGFLIGAVVPQFGSGCRPVPSQKGFFVSEGDEYDTAFFDKRSKFLSYRPDIAVINNIEFDHADIFPTLEHLISSFRLFARLVPRSGVLLVGEEHAAARRAVADALAPVEIFGLQESADWRAADCTVTASGAEFTVVFRERALAQCTLALAGEHNIRNAMAAFAAGYHAGAHPQAMAQALANFTPPKRRMEVLVQTSVVTVIDDFAHHPTALEATIAATRQRYPNRRILLCFEPRSNTTTRNIFQNELATALSNADCVYLGALNRPERYSVQEILNVPQLLLSLTEQGKSAFSVQQQQQEWGKELFDMLRRDVQEGDVILLCSNGDWNGLRKMLSDYFIN